MLINCGQEKTFRFISFFFTKLQSGGQVGEGAILFTIKNVWPAINFRRERVFGTSELISASCVSLIAVLEIKEMKLEVEDRSNSIPPSFLWSERRSITDTLPVLESTFYDRQLFFFLTRKLLCFFPHFFLFKPKISLILRIDTQRQTDRQTGTKRACPKT